ncbi:TolC family protein [Chitinophaga lutea]|uniref:TolC family protein n=1 Tax=Chitinophaga lutea TaxID=2488634 RepID=A0A3N4QRA7_9BACT|nr:TolC family protein [Chitinophaga lutea]RPE14114.1 TolC family protein [Chitinophaga lutea]
MTRRYPVHLLLLVMCLSAAAAQGQVLTMKDAIQTALNNYGTIKAKANYANASKATAEQARRDYLPNLSISAQQDYGTVNGQNGPLYGFGGLGVASSGLPLPDQNWNAAFGALYLANINWEFFAFGRAKEKVKTAQSAAYRDERDREQESFRHEIKVAATYLNLLAAQRLTRSWERNLERADTFRAVVKRRASNGLIAGVDSSLANAEVASARIALTRSADLEQEQSNQLAQLMGVAPSAFVLDTAFLTRLPAVMTDTVTLNTDAHPVLRFYRSRIDLSHEQEKYIRTLNFPAFSFFSVLQTRASGFSSAYATDQTAFTHNYWDGVKPTRSNYLLGIGVTWNLTSPLRVKQQSAAQQFTSKALQNEMEVVDQQLKAQLVLADVKIKNALSNYQEAGIQLRSASQAYLQKTVMYQNGLSTLVDVTQALYSLNRAETERDVAYSNVWQALLLKAAAAGNFGLFINEF